MSDNWRCAKKILIQQPIRYYTQITECEVKVEHKGFYQIALSTHTHTFVPHYQYDSHANIVSKGLNCIRN